MPLPLPSLLSATPPQAWIQTPEGLTAHAGPQTDLIIDPYHAKTTANAPTLLFPAPAADFLLQAEVQVDFQSTFDAAVLLLYAGPTHWAKLCFEFSPARQPMVVSVVTNATSDDANGPIPTTPRVHLRIGRRGPTAILHYSENGALWHLVRVFRLPEAPLQAGFLVQSPTGQGATAHFRQIALTQTTLTNIRNGQ